MPYLSALEVCSRRGAIQIHVYLTLLYLTLLTPEWRTPGMADPNPTVTLAIQSKNFDDHSMALGLGVGSVG